MIQELNRLMPTVASKPGRFRRLKGLLLQLMRPFASQQIDFNRQVIVSLESLSARIDRVEEVMLQLTEKIYMMPSGGVAAPAGGKGAGVPEALNDAVGEDQALRQALEEGHRLRGDRGITNVLDKRDQWDVLMILDACRYDTFEKVNHLPGRLSSIISPGAWTFEWFRNTFDRDASDVVYISGNPHISRSNFRRQTMNVRLAHLEEVFLDGWDKSLQTVPADAILERYFKLKDQFRGCRFILHFMQPHQPCIGKTRLAMQFQMTIDRAVEEDGEVVHNPLESDLVRKGVATQEQLVQAYEDNLRYVLETIEKSLPKIDGKVTMTADHGEMLGEHGVYDHHYGKYFRQLIEVPWFETTGTGH